MYIMRFIDDLYLGQAVKAKEKRIIKKIKKGSFFTGAYVICLPEKTDEPLEFYSARLLKQDYYKRHEPTIIGIASNEDEAIEVVNDILKDCIKKTGSLNMRSYTEMLCKGPVLPEKKE